MIHAVSAANQQLYARELDQMFRQREGSAGSGSRRHGTDELDDQHAVYLIRLDQDRRVVESVRLNPSSQGWQTSLWPDEPSDALVAGVLKFCEMQGLTRLMPPAEPRLAERIAASRP